MRVGSEWGAGDDSQQLCLSAASRFEAGIVMPLDPMELTMLGSQELEMLNSSDDILQKAARWVKVVVLVKHAEGTSGMGNLGTMKDYEPTVKMNS
jgi:hypothetical protein